METFLLIVAVIYPAAAACAIAGVILVAIGASYHIKRWFIERRGPQPLISAEDADAASQTVTIDPPTAV